jgi:hypothetical protein
MGLAGEHEQNLWKEMSCRQNIENVRVSGTEIDLRMNSFVVRYSRWAVSRYLWQFW